MAIRRHSLLLFGGEVKRLSAQAQHAVTPPNHPISLQEDIAELR
jgi:hypothetical protein